MLDFLLGSLISAFLIFISTSFFYEILRVTWNFLPRLRGLLHLRIVVTVMAIFIGHTVVVWFYGLTYFVLEKKFQMLGTLEGVSSDDFFSFVYFSAAVYSSLGLGDVYPTGGFRLLTGVEVLNGLLLIGMSASFIFMVMQKFWDMHGTDLKSGHGV